MGDNTREKTLLEMSQTELKAKRLAFWTAIVVLASTMIPAVAAVFTYLEIKGSLAKFVEKPFEGEWDYSSDYEVYYKEFNPQDLHGKGKATILWKYSESRYDITLSYAIKRDHVEIPLLVSMLKGTLITDGSDWPVNQPFMMDFELIERLHYQLKVHNLRKYQFKNCNYARNGNGERAQTITCILETEVSKSKVTFTREAGLH